MSRELSIAVYKMPENLSKNDFPKLTDDEFIELTEKAKEVRNSDFDNLTDDLQDFVNEHNIKPDGAIHLPYFISENGEGCEGLDSDIIGFDITNKELIAKIAGADRIGFYYY